MEKGSIPYFATINHQNHIIMKNLQKIYKKLDKTDVILISTLIVSALFFIINL